MSKDAGPPGAAGDEYACVNARVELFALFVLVDCLPLKMLSENKGCLRFTTAIPCLLPRQLNSQLTFCVMI